MSGLDLQGYLAAAGRRIPIIVVTGSTTMRCGNGRSRRALWTSAQAAKPRSLDCRTWPLPQSPAEYHVGHGETNRSANQNSQARKSELGSGPPFQAPPVVPTEFEEQVQKLRPEELKRRNC
jgi:hypothetical protein